MVTVIVGPRRKKSTPTEIARSQSLPADIRRLSPREVQARQSFPSGGGGGTTIISSSPVSVAPTQVSKIIPQATLRNIRLEQRISQIKKEKRLASETLKISKVSQVLQKEIEKRRKKLTTGEQISIKRILPWNLEI